jgi:hypothetical protein
MIIIVTIVWLLIIGFILLIVRSGHNQDNTIRVACLRDEARRIYPHIPLEKALDCLYIDRLRTILYAHKKGNFDTEELEEDLILLLNERNAIIMQSLQQLNNERGEL